MNVLFRVLSGTAHTRSHLRRVFVRTVVGEALDELVHDEFLWIAGADNHAQLALPAGAKTCAAAVGTFAPSASGR